MLPYALRRLVLALPLLLGITLISFCLMHLAPGEPTDMGSPDIPTTSDKEMRDRLRQEWGLDKPLHVQYWNWVTRIVQLDFGRSLSGAAPAAPATCGRRCSGWCGRDPSSPRGPRA